MSDQRSSRAFSRIAQWTAEHSGRASTFVTACVVIMIWAVTGPVFNYSDTWQLIINTGTTIVTFLMVFLMQNTQNRDTISIQIKLDELIRANEKARNRLLSLDELSEEQLKRLKETFARLADSPPEVQRKLAEARDELVEAGEKVEQAGGQVVEAQDKLLDAATQAHAHAKEKTD